MMNLRHISEPSLSSRANQEGGTLILSLRGTVDEKSRVNLQELLDSVHAESQRLTIRQVVIDLRHLDFMNSSGMKVIVSWINEARKLTGRERYGIKFVINPELHWQRRSIHAMQGFGDNLVTIETSSS